MKEEKDYKFYLVREDILPEAIKNDVTPKS